jgi:penicillin-binding protein 1A
VVSEGTARRAQLDGIPAAGKTGTTNNYRDAWFVGYTGNFVGGVWYGNDDYSPTNRMTGGSLPAKTWHDIMEVAHQGVEIRDIPGVGPGKPLPHNVAAANAAKGGEINPGPPPILTRRGANILVRVEKMMDEAAKTAGATPPPAGPNGKTTSASPPGSRASSSPALTFPDSFAAATPGDDAGDKRSAQ